MWLITIKTNAVRDLTVSGRLVLVASFSGASWLSAIGKEKGHRAFAPDALRSRVSPQARREPDGTTPGGDISQFPLRKTVILVLLDDAVVRLINHTAQIHIVAEVAGVNRLTAVG